MADPDRKRGGGNGCEEVGHRDKIKPGKALDEDDLLGLLKHPLRRLILRFLHASDTPLSPAEIDASLEIQGKPKSGVPTVHYHVGQLAKSGVVSLVKERPVRGAREHFYASEVEGIMWVRDVLKRTERKDKAMRWPTGGRASRKKRSGKKKDR